MIPKGKFNPRTSNPRDTFVYTVMVKTLEGDRAVYGTHDFADALIRAGEFTQLSESLRVKVFRGLNEVIFSTYRDHTGRFIAVSSTDLEAAGGPMSSWSDG